MTVEGKYIYSIIDKKDEKRIFGPIGINSREVKFLYYKDIAAVVSNTPLIKFNRLDTKELTKHITIHQKVNEEVMKYYNVVPMSFGAIAPNAEEVFFILKKAYLQFKTALEKTADKIEFVVQVCWDRKRILNDLINADSEIQELRQEVSLKKSILDMPIRLKLGKAIQQKMEARKKNYVDSVQSFLGNLACDYTLNKLLNEEMIANFSFLVKRSHGAELDKRMSRLGKKYKSELRFKYIGPMPPYSFVNINLSSGNYEVINESRKLLKLGEEATFDRIKKAYYKFAYEYHPDRKKSEENLRKMKKITIAYGILKNYCHSCDENSGKIENQKYSFRKRDIKNFLWVK